MDDFEYIERDGPSIWSVVGFFVVVAILGYAGIRLYSPCAFEDSAEKPSRRCVESRLVNLYTDTREIVDVISVEKSITPGVLTVVYEYREIPSLGQSVNATRLRTAELFAKSKNNRWTSVAYQDAVYLERDEKVESPKDRRWEYIAPDQNTP